MTDIRPDDASICPRCGNGGIRCMDLSGTMPMLDEVGYPLYYCRACGNTFTGLTRPDEPVPSKEMKGSLCPRCGSDGILIMNLDETLPLLDEFGYRQYYCETCGKPYTDRTRPQKHKGKKRLELKDLFPPFP